MVDKRVCGECQDDLCLGQFGQNAVNETETYLRKSCLIKKENRSTSPRLPPLNFRRDAINLVLERVVANNNPFIIDFVAAFIQNSSKVVRMGLLLVHEIEFAIEMWRFGLASV